ncbi:MAG: tetratricopeptide repeat protein [Polyangiaceae bacterium]|jgi:tetratricopeptide (TPR) repeat protein
MNYYWTYYALTFFAAYAVRNPWICGVVLAFYALRPWLPDPVVILRNLGRIGALKRQVTLNASNVTARRDLGRAYLELRRPRTALRYLDEARARDPRDPEIAYLRGLALLGARDDEEALRAFGVAVGVDPDKGEPFSSVRGEGSRFNRFGEAYLAAATALERLERYAQAEEALAMAAMHNSSLLEPLVRLARVRRSQGNAEGAREAARNARRTFGELPGFMRRRQIGWAIRAYLA